jgi:hypothetical protein
VLSGIGNIVGPVVDNGTIIAAADDYIGFGGDLSGTGEVEVGSGADVYVNTVVGNGVTFIFDSNAGSLIFTSGISNEGTISGFVSGDEIELEGVPATSATYTPGSGGTGTLTVTDNGTPVASLILEGDYTGQPFLTVPDSNIGSTDIVLICFCSGTQIGTPTGDVAVEHLKVGDAVLTLSGEARPIIWIGIDHVLATRGRRNAATPVLIRKGALAENVPHHDLRVTKAHALFIDDVLIPVEFLVKHRTICWDDRAQEVTVYHIELETHDVLIANGAPAESYRDDGNRWLFDNANSGWDLPPKKSCAPVLTGGPHRRCRVAPSIGPRRAAQSAAIHRRS